MTASLPIRFFRYTTRQAISPETPAWREFLPSDRHSTRSAEGVSLADYFTALADFLNDSGNPAFRDGVAALFGAPYDPAALESVDVILEKHGAFYHPARVRVRGAGGVRSFVVNVAVSEAGRRIIAGEYDNLCRLGGPGAASALPRVFGMGAGRSPHGAYPMFLGEWLGGFSEFHLSRAEAGGLRMVVWDGDGVNFFLSSAQVDRLYREVARILARHYNPSTFEQIFPWNHAAGDFVVRAAAPELAVRLVTVRGYAPLFAHCVAEAGRAPGGGGLGALLLFLANLSLRTRVDRLDGVGDVVLAEVSAIGPTIAGMLAGIAERADFEEDFRAYLRGRSPAQLADAFMLVMEGWHPGAAETAPVRAALADHVLAFWEAVNGL